MNKFYGIVVSFVLVSSFLLPITNVNGAGIVPDCGKTSTSINKEGKEVSTVSNPCGFDDFMELINNAIDFFLFKIATPFIALIIMYTGYLFLTAGGSAGQTEKAKKILSNVIIGYAVALGAWLIVNTILSSFKVDTKEINTFIKK